MWNPTRRSRKMGKTQGGRVKGGKAREKRTRGRSRDLFVKLTEEAGTCRIHRETPAGGHFHPCSGEDYLEVLGRLPPELVAPVKAVVLRREPRHQRFSGVEAQKIGQCIVMHSFSKSMAMPFPPSPGRRLIRHYAPWCRRWSFYEEVSWLVWTLDEVRRYYRYHLFLHELGHLHEPRRTSSRRRREEFAENFALEWARRLGELDQTYDEAARPFLREAKGPIASRDSEDGT